MEHPDEFIKILRQIMSQECKPLLSKEEIEQSIREIEAMELVGDSYVVWLNWVNNYEILNSYNNPNIKCILLLT